MKVKKHEAELKKSVPYKKSMCFVGTCNEFRSAMGNNRQPALILMHVHRNILNNINLADVANEFADRKESRKQTIYRSPNQLPDNFETFIDNFELNLETLSQKNLFLLVAISDFNAKSKFWYCNDTTSQGKTLENVTSQFGLHQVIKEPTHILHNSSSCIDLIFSSQPNLIIESGVHPSLHPNCHHQLIYAKFNLPIYYPPQYHREVWHYNDANTELIIRTVDQLNWQKHF